jgi:hypothetical protein
MSMLPTQTRVWVGSPLLYICTSIKQYKHLPFGGTPLSNTTNDNKRNLEGVARKKNLVCILDT